MTEKDANTPFSDEPLDADTLPPRRDSRPFLRAQLERMRERYEDRGLAFPAAHPTYEYPGLRFVTDEAFESSKSAEVYVPGAEVKNIAYDEVSKAYWRAFATGGPEPSADIIRPYLDHLIPQEQEEVRQYIDLIREDLGFDSIEGSSSGRRKMGRHSTQLPLEPSAPEDVPAN